MELWLQGVWILLQGGAATILSRWLYPFRSIAAGAVTGLTLCGLLPTAMQLCSTLVLICSLALGVILSVFLRESTHRAPDLLWGGWLMTSAYLQTQGVLPLLSLSHLLPLRAALTDGKLRWCDLFFLLPVSAGLGAGQLCALPVRWQGMMLGIACGMLLQGVCKHKGIAGGAAIGVILSFI